LGTLFLSVELVYFVFCTPAPSDLPLKPYRIETYLGTVAYTAAYAFSLLRLPFSLIPYLTKLCFFIIFKSRYKSLWNSYLFQALGVLGDFVNLAVTPFLIVVIVGVARNDLVFLMLRLSLVAEFIRLMSEKGQMICSAIWQMIPHRAIARTLIGRQASYPAWLARYCCYYALDDDQRMQYLLHALKRRASADPNAAARLEYVRAFRVVPPTDGLRCKRVRDVARGEVFIHRSWTNDPWLLIGQALRRSPWMFDPRYLRRPFYYRTESNRLATLFVLSHVRYSLPYAWYQFGHEIKAAKYDLFYRMLRQFGFDTETPVQEDGTYQFDQFIGWLKKRFGQAIPSQRPLWTDEEVIADVWANGGEGISAQYIAEHYTYPLKYVEEVLLDKIYAVNQTLPELPPRRDAALPNEDSGRCLPAEYLSHQSVAGE
jgi:hypothetical protein